MAVIFGLALMVFVTSCASTKVAPDQQNDCFLGDYYKNLAPGPDGGVKMRWLKPGVDFAKYNKVMLDSVVFFFAKDADYKGMDPNELKTLAAGPEILVNGTKVAEGRIERTQPMIFSADEGADVGEDGETPVVEDYGIPAPYKFTGKIDKITIDLKEMKASDKAEEDKLRAEAALKKAQSD